MGFSAAPRLTQLGQRAKMRSFEGIPLDFPNGKFLIGSKHQPGTSAWSLTGLLQPVAEVPISYVMRQQINPGIGAAPEDGLSFVRLRGIIPVGLLPDNFIVGELGIQVPSNLEDVPGNILWAYTNADDPEVYRMRGSSLTAEVIDIFILISDDAAITLTPDLGMAAATLFDIDEALEAHNVDPNANPQAIERHNRAADAHAELFAALSGGAADALAATIAAHNSAAAAHGPNIDGRIAAHNTSGTAHAARFAAANAYADSQAQGALSSANSYTDSKIAGLSIPTVEAGPWTPGLVDGGPTTVQDLGCRFCRVNRIVTVWLKCRVANANTLSSNTVQFSGLPYAVSNGPAVGTLGLVDSSGASTAWNNSMATALGASVYCMTSTGGSITYAAMPGLGGFRDIAATITYETNV